MHLGWINLIALQHVLHQRAPRLSELLDSVIKRYQNRSIETAQVIEELIEMAKKFA
nr:DUF3387 domain-containing protein [Pseudomonas aeruginosa]